MSPVLLVKNLIVKFNLVLKSSLLTKSIVYPFFLVHVDACLWSFAEKLRTSLTSIWTPLLFIQGFLRIIVSWPRLKTLCSIILEPFIFRMKCDFAKVPALFLYISILPIIRFIFTWTFLLQDISLIDCCFCFWQEPL